MLTTEEKFILLKLARAALRKRAGLEAEEPDINENLLKPSGTFVSLYLNDALRGCIGYIEPVKPLAHAVIECVVAAGWHDPRFPPLTKDELEKIQIEISILSKPKPASIDEIEGKGVILKAFGRSATFLPQVWKQLPNKEIFLTELCLKAGLPPDAWQNPKTKIYAYDAEIISEKMSCQK